MVSNADYKKIESTFNGKDEVVSKYEPIYPYSCERELKRVMVAYANTLVSEVRKKFPEMEKAYKAQRDIDRGKVREDGLMDLRTNLLDSMVSITDEIEKKSGTGKYDKLVNKVGKMTVNHVSREWNRGIQKTFDVKNTGDDFWAYLVAYLLNGFGSKVKLRMTDMKVRFTNQIMSSLMDSYQAGLSMSDAFRKLSKELTRVKRRAGMDARDIVGGLTADAGRETGSHFGMNRYVWCTKRDDRVRECHRTLEGRVFSYSNPPEMWYRGRGGMIVWTGRKCNPGEDYGCRCVAKPVFSWEGIRRMLGI